jgi:uncharacterized protein
MMTRGVALLILLSLLLLPWGGPSAQTFQPIPVPGGMADHTGKVWQPAPDIPGALSWSLLMRTKEDERKINDVWYIVPVFPKELLRFNNTRVKVNGFMLPLQTAREQNYFVLMAFPPDCPFCLTIGSMGWMEVRAAEKITFQKEPLLVEGRLELVKRDMEGTFYRLHEARRVRG